MENPIESFLAFFLGITMLVGLLFFQLYVEKSTTTKDLKQCVASQEWCAIEQPKLYEIIYEGDGNETN